MKINSTEVAKKAGVSRSTVSRVINNNPNVIESTRKRVLKVIEELNYTPNTNAQTLAGKKSSVIGLFIVETNYNNALDTSLLEYFMNFVSKLSEEVFRNKHQLLLDVVYDQESEIRVKSLFQNGNISCGIFIGSPMHNKFIDYFITSDNKIALIDYSTDPSLLRPNVSLINTDDLNAAIEITTELLKSGSRKILHITGNLQKLTAAQRLAGYKQALVKSGIPVIEGLIYKGSFTEKSGYDAVARTLKSGTEFDSIFAANDLMARGAKAALDDAGISDIPIWGYDNLQGSVPLGIMTADPCLKDSAIKAVRSLLNPVAENRQIQYTQPRLVKDMHDYLSRYEPCHHD